MKFSLFLICLSLCFLSPANAQKDVEQVVILGSGPAGLTAAIYTARAGLTTVVVEGDEPGGQITYSHLVENFPGFPQGISGFDLGQQMRNQAQKCGARILSSSLEQVDLTKYPFEIKLHGNKILFAQTLIIALGASPRWLGLPSEKALIGNGVSSCAVCDGSLYKNKEVIVVGGGDTALEDALYLSKNAAKVTVVHRRDTLRASKILQDKAFADTKIKFIWNTTIEEILDPKLNDVTGVILKDQSRNTIKFYPCQGVFVAIGNIPNTNLFKGQLKLNSDGYIITQPFSTHTSVPGVFAAGDVSDAHYRQAITAAGTGCMAGIDANHFIMHKEQSTIKE